MITKTDEPVASWSNPISELRFKEKEGRRILQQAWQCCQADSRGIQKQWIEWRDVECVGPDAPDVKETL